MKCGHCLIQRRIAGLEKTGEEPDLKPVKGDGLPRVNDAITMMGGTAFCGPCLVEQVKLQRQMHMVQADGSPLLIPAGTRT